MLARLNALAVVRVSGADTATFLQGQLSADIRTLEPTRARLTSINSPQGRVQAVAWMVAADDDVLLVVPAEIVEPVAQRLRRYVLRAKVAIDTALTEWSCLAADDAGLAALPGAPAVPTAAAGAVVASGGLRVLRVAMGQQRYLVLGKRPHDAWQSLSDASLAWRLADIRAGLPRVGAATSETFVAQMLNLDLLDAISFTKGCYTGQEIIARAHYRGAVKRRMARFGSQAPAPAAGARVLSDGAHAGEIVDGVASDEGAELLAVVSLAKLDDSLALEDGRRLERMELPYSI